MVANIMFHVHTHRCGHSSDDREIDYVKKALALEARTIVFTDHCPFPGDPFYQRMKIQELPDYIRTLQDLREAYKDCIHITIGLETEYVPEYKNFYHELLESYGVDMLLLGQHFSRMADGRYSFVLQDVPDEAKVLLEGMLQGIETGLFSVVAHPDQIFRRYHSWNEEALILSKQLFEAARCTGIVLEKNIDNMLAYPEGHNYWPEFWELCPPDVKTIYGLDAHSVEALERNYLVSQEPITDVYKKSLLSKM